MLWGNARFSPRVRMHTPLAWSASSSRRKYSINNPSKASTSPAGRFQFSVENAYRDRASMPRSLVSWIRPLSRSMPARCPKGRGNPRALAHRPLPSIMMPTCRGSSAASPRLAGWILAMSPPFCRLPPAAPLGPTPVWAGSRTSLWIVSPLTRAIVFCRTSAGASRPAPGWARSHPGPGNTATGRPGPQQIFLFC